MNKRLEVPPRHFENAAAIGFLLLLFVGTGLMLYGVIVYTGWPVVWIILGYMSFLWIYAFIIWIMALAFGWGYGMMG